MKKFQIKRYKKMILILIYVCFLIYGLCTYKDYGISVDEKVQREHGITNLRYVYELLNGTENLPEYLEGYPSLDEYKNKYYGIGIKIPLLLIEYANGFQMTNQQIYDMNHLYTFLLFFIASIFVYRLCRKLGMTYRYCVLAVIMFIICPRILADSFYNIKDSTFLSLFVIMLYYGLSVINKFRIKDAAGLAVSAAFCLNTRIVGALPLAVMCLIYIVWGGGNERKRMLRMAAAGLASCAVYLLITPASWGHFFEYIYHTAAVFSDYSSFDTVTLGRTVYKGDRLPWYYTILCIALTMPNLYLVSSLAGIFVTVKKYICSKSRKAAISDHLLEFTLLLQFFSVLLYDAVMKPVKYNMWRHFYFLFIYIVIFSVAGIKYAVENMGKYRYLAAGCTGLSIVLTAVWDIRNHPYEYVYYNFLYAANLSDSMHHDYWAVSDMDLLRSVEDHDVNVYPRNELTAMYFGEDGWEKYHSSGEAYGAEYRFRTIPNVSTQNSTKENQNILYKTEKKIEVDDRDISILDKRMNYDNCILKYAIDSSGKVIGENKGPEIEWEFSSSEEEKYLLAHIPQDYGVYEIDFITSQKQEVQNLCAYASEDGRNWNRYDNAKNIFSSQDMFALISEKPIPAYLKIKYETGINCGNARAASFIVRVYGRAGRKFESMYSENNADGLQYLADDDESTAWTTGQAQKKGMYVSLELPAEKMIWGMKIVSNAFDYARDLSIQYQDENGDYQDILYTTDDNEKYVFQKPVICTNIRLVNQGDLKLYWWTIYEMELDTEETYAWSYKDTKETVVNAASPYGKELLSYLTDNDAESVWTTEESQSSGMYLDIELKPETVIRGFHLDSGKAVFENARGIKIYGSYTGNDWNEITYHYGAAADYVFYEGCDYPYYRIIQTEDDKNHPWSIAQLGILKTRQNMEEK